MRLNRYALYVRTIVWLLGNRTFVAMYLFQKLLQRDHDKLGKTKTRRGFCICICLKRSISVERSTKQEIYAIEHYHHIYY